MKKALILGVVLACMIAPLAARGGRGGGLRGGGMRGGGFRGGFHGGGGMRAGRVGGFHGGGFRPGGGFGRAGFVRQGGLARPAGVAARPMRPAGGRPGVRRPGGVRQGGPRPGAVRSAGGIGRRPGAIGSGAGRRGIAHPRIGYAGRGRHAGWYGGRGGYGNHGIWGWHPGIGWGWGPGLGWGWGLPWTVGIIGAGVFMYRYVIPEEYIDTYYDDDYQYWGYGLGFGTELDTLAQQDAWDEISKKLTERLDDLEQQLAELRRDGNENSDDGQQIARQIGLIKLHLNGIQNSGQSLVQSNDEEIEQEDLALI